MRQVIQIVGYAGKEPFEKETFLKSYDADFVPPPPEPLYPSGWVEYTHDIGEAQVFESLEEAWYTVTRRSATVPHRPDGEANRPLMSFTIVMISAPTAHVVEEATAS